MRLSPKFLTAVFGILFIVAVAFFLYERSSLEVKKTEMAKLTKECDSLSIIALNFQYKYGLEIARQKCMSCHRFHLATDNLLAGVVDRRGKDYLKLYLTKQDSLISVSDSIAIELKNQYGNLGNSHNFQLDEDEFEALIEFMSR